MVFFFEQRGGQAEWVLGLISPADLDGSLLPADPCSSVSASSLGKSKVYALLIVQVFCSANSCCHTNHASLSVDLSRQHESLIFSFVTHEVRHVEHILLLNLHTIRTAIAGSLELLKELLEHTRSRLGCRPSLLLALNVTIHLVDPTCSLPTFPHSYRCSAHRTTSRLKMFSSVAAS